MEKLRLLGGMGLPPDRSRLSRMMCTMKMRSYCYGKDKTGTGG